MKTIMLYINKIADGGAERAIVNLATELSEREYKTILVTSFRTKDEYTIGTKVERLSLEDEQIHRSKVTRNLFRIRSLREICKVRQPDVLITFMAEPIVRAQIATIGLDIKNIVSVRSNPERVYPGFKGGILGKILLPMADGCVFQTKEAQEWFPKRLQRKSEIIYNPVAPIFYKKKRTPIRHKIVTCGRLCEVKNHKMLFQAFKKVLESIPDARLEVYGIGELENDLQTLIKNMQLTGVVQLMGNALNIADILAKTDLFVLSSDQEGLPNALMEAMAVGVPSVSTDCPCGGPRELFGQDLCNMLVPVGDADSLAHKMKELLIDDEERLYVGLQMRERAEMFRADMIGEQWNSYIEQILDEIEAK